MKDLISRQEAMEEISKQQTYKMFEGEDTLYLDANDVGSVLASLPSAQPELKKGKWIYNSPVTMKCNQCGLVIKDWDWHRFKYCPNCISDMRGEQE